MLLIPINWYSIIHEKKAKATKDFLIFSPPILNGIVPIAYKGFFLFFLSLPHNKYYIKSDVFLTRSLSKRSTRHLETTWFISSENIRVICDVVKSHSYPPKNH